MKFLFYDVETANQQQIGSICAVGWCLVQNMTVVDQGYTLINPHTDFNPYAVRIHGITAEDVKDAPSFAEYWRSCLGNLMRECVVVAHGADFDIRSTEQALFDSGIPDDGIDYYDFLPVSQRLIPECENHKLNTLADWADVSFCHHCASEDCCALFQIAKTLCERKGFDSLEEMFARSRSVMKNSSDNTFDPQAPHETVKKAKTHFEQHKKHEGPIMQTDDALAGCSFCITGNVADYSRSQVEEMIVSRGGEFKSGVSRKLDFLIVGPYGDGYPVGYMSGKHKEAIALVDQGYPLQIISAEQFLEIMQDPAASPLVVFAAARKPKEKKNKSPYPQTPQEIETMWKEFVYEPTDDDDAFSFSATQSGFSFFVYGRKSFELIRGKKGMTLRISGDLMQLLDTEREDLDEMKFYPLPTDQISTFPSLLKAHKKYVFRNLITDTFACCHRFMQCSDARACLMPYDRTYNGCYYRRNLEKGLIFYGKNRNADENGLFAEEKRPD